MGVEDVTLIGWILFGFGIFLAISGLIFDFDEALAAIGISTLSIGCFSTVLGGSVLVFATWMDNALFISVLSLLNATVLTVLVHFYVIPLKKTEASLSVSIEKLKGATGEVITTIPVDGMGEILVKDGLGIQNRSAISYNKEEIPEGSKVLVIEVNENVCSVSKIDENYT